MARALAGDAPVLLMDEPFSAVDPVVRVELQDELLRLQADLGKTILFVTHDIDEAIRLGDRVAVLRVGGRLAQFAPPDELLAHPADEFVSGFVGRDRGYRRLGFVPATALQLAELPTARGRERRLGRAGGVDGAARRGRASRGVARARRGAPRAGLGLRHRGGGRRRPRRPARCAAPWTRR